MAPAARWRRTGIWLVGAISGALGGLGAAIVVEQSGRLPVGVGFIIPVVATLIGITLGLVGLPRRVERVLAIASAATLMLVVVVSVSSPATAQTGSCAVTLSGTRFGQVDLLSTTRSDPFIIDLSGEQMLAVSAAAEEVSQGTLEISVRSVEPLGFLTRPDEIVVFYGAITDGSVSTELTLGHEGPTGFTAVTSDYRSPVIPFGLMEMSLVVTDISEGFRDTACDGVAWVRIVARPVTNTTGVAGVALMALGFGTLAMMPYLKEHWLPNGPRPPIIPTSSPHGDAVRVRVSTTDGKAVSPDEPLIPGATYRLSLEVGVGHPVGGSIIATTSSSRFQVGEPVVRLGPGPNGHTADISFIPQQTGRHSLVVDLTTRANLLQTERIAFAVGADDVGRHQATTIFAASDFSVADLEERRARRLLIILESDPVDHSVDARFIDDTGQLLAAFDTVVQPQALVKAAGQARTMLRSVLAAGPGHDRSRPGEDRAALIPIVKAGRALHTALFAPGGPGSGGDVSTLVSDRAVIQVVQNRSGLGFSTLPWHLVYDHPFVPRSEGIRFCAAFPSHPTDQCPNRDDLSVFCPTGFWGYRSIIEEPWVTVESAVLASPSNRPTEAGPGASYFLPNLSFSPKGTEALTARGVRQIMDFEDLVEVIETCPDLSLLYFYTHHRRDEHDLTPGIQVGNDLVTAPILIAYQSSWTSKPLVFINGCGTGDYALDDPISLIDSFRHMGAAGAISTETTMWDRLAGELGAEMLDRLFSGGEAGPVLLEMRRDLLDRFVNPVGLAYRLHTLSDTRVGVGRTEATTARSVSS